MSTIYLIRHGQASFGKANYDELSALGRRQADMVGQYFQDCQIRWDAVYSGNLRRQIDTAELATAHQSNGPGLRVDARFNEIQNDQQIERLVPEIVKSNAAIAELVARGLESSKDYQKVIEAVFNYWVSPECVDPELQSWSDYAGKVRGAVKDLMQEQGSGKSVAVFTSGGTIATIVAQVLGLDGDQTYQFYEPVINCSVTRLFYNSRKISLSYFNDHSFLDVMGRQRQEQLITYR